MNVVICSAIDHFFRQGRQQCFQFRQGIFGQVRDQMADVVDAVVAAGFAVFLEGFNHAVGCGWMPDADQCPQDGTALIRVLRLAELQLAGLH